MSLRIIAALAALSLVSAVAALAQEEDSLAPQTIDELVEAIAAVIDEHDVPAVGLAVVGDAGPEWIGSLGKASIEDDIDADADTIYRIGSTSKMFVALAVLQLVEEGRLSLDDKLAELAPEIEFENPWEEAQPVRLVHLLEHTTGWDDIHLPEYAHNDPTPATLREGLDYHPHSRKSRWPPGSRYSYCNAGPPVAAYIVQKVTGQDFEDYVQENFFTPLGMTGSTYQRSEGVLEKGATLYASGRPVDYWHIIMRPSGAINASPADMARFLQLFLGRGTVEGVQYVSEDSIARMETAMSTSGAKAGLEVGYGLHNYTSTHEHWVYNSHNGGVEGGLTEFAYMPDATSGYAFMINAGSGAAYVEISDLIRNYQTRDLARPDVRAVTQLSESDQTVAGLYHPINPRQQISYFLDRALGIERFWVENGELKRRPLLGGEVTSYLPAGDGLFRSPKYGRINLAVAEDPLAGPVIHAGTQVLRPVSALVVYGQLTIAVLWVVSIVSSFLYFLVWGVRKVRGKVPAGASTRIRVWPLLASASVVLFVILFGVAMSSMKLTFDLLGEPTGVSISIMLATIAFALFAALGLYTAIRERKTAMNKANYWHSATTSFVHVLVAAYLAWFGVIGIQTWA